MTANELVLGALDIRTRDNEMAHVRSGDRWLPMRLEPKGPALEAISCVPLDGLERAGSPALQPVLLDLYRQDPIATRREIERRARRARNEDIRGFLDRLFA